MVDSLENDGKFVYEPRFGDIDPKRAGEDLEEDRLPEDDVMVEQLLGLVTLGQEDIDKIKRRKNYPWEPKEAILIRGPEPKRHQVISKMLELAERQLIDERHGDFPVKTELVARVSWLELELGLGQHSSIATQTGTAYEPESESGEVIESMAIIIGVHPQFEQRYYEIRESLITRANQHLADVDESQIPTEPEKRDTGSKVKTWG